MAIRLSTARLAGAVAREGGVGLVAASGLELDELRQEIRLARKLSEGRGMIGINAMVAARAFADLITTAAEEKVDLLVAGAGFSRDIFAIGRAYNVAVVPIVSSVKLAKISEKLGASAIVVEGTEAGGHLGTQESIKTILPDIIKAVKIPVIAAGGAVCGADLRVSAAAADFHLPGQQCIQHNFHKYQPAPPGICHAEIGGHDAEGLSQDDELRVPAVRLQGTASRFAGVLRHYISHLPRSHNGL